MVLPLRNFHWHWNDGINKMRNSSRIKAYNYLQSTIYPAVSASGSTNKWDWGFFPFGSKTIIKNIYRCSGVVFIFHFHPPSSAPENISTSMYHQTLYHLLSYICYSTFVILHLLSLCSKKRYQWTQWVDGTCRSKLVNNWTLLCS